MTSHFYTKRDLPVHEARRYLEPGPIVLVSSAHDGQTNIMTMGWHTVLEFAPSLIGCMITSANHSHDMIRKSKECVINLPTVDMIDAVVRIGNCHGGTIDKFTAFGLTPLKATKVSAPLIAECHSHFECVLHDNRMVKDYNFFIFKIVKASVATRPEFPKTLHYRGDGIFMTSGGQISRKRLFRPENL